MSIHPTAIIDPKAEIDEGVEIQPYAIIGAQVRIGAGTVVGPHAVIDGRTVIGRDNRIFSGAQIGVPSQDLKHCAGQVGRVQIGDGNDIREFMTLSASTIESPAEDDRVTSVGNDCLLMACSHIGHDCHLGDGIVLSNYAGLAGHVNVEDKAIISGLTGVHQEGNVGTLSYLAAMARASKDIPPYMLVEGNPGRVAGPNTIGLQRNGLDADARNRIKQIFRIMSRSNLNTSQALAEIERSVDDSPEKTHFLEFVRKSKRGVTV
jgi:UDP-N-acetylglucosamine acyltransferase